MGASNGGMMTYRLAITKPEKLAAATAIIANLPQAIFKSHFSEQLAQTPIPLLIINGTKDPMMPWEGGDIRFGPMRLGKVVSTAQTMAFWIKRNGCSSVPKEEDLPDKAPNDGTRIIRKTFEHPQGKGDVILLGVIGGGHTLPGLSGNRGRLLVGRTSQDIQVAEYLWNFLKQHRRQ